MTAPLRVLALFGPRVVFGSERGNIEALSVLREAGSEILCLVRPEAEDQGVTAALEARNLPWRKVPYIDNQLRDWGPRMLWRNLKALVAGNWQFLRIVREYRPSHIHAFNQNYVLSFLPALCLVSVPAVYRAGDQPIRHRLVWRMLWRITAWRVRRFVVVSRFMAGELVAVGVPAEHIEVIYSRPPKRGAGDAAAIIPLSIMTTRNILFIGQIIADKGPHLLVEAFRTLVGKYPEARLLIAGRISDWTGDDWARDLRDKAASDPVLASKVAFLGYVEDVPGLLQRSEVLVAPSIKEEPLANVVMEAKRAGVPSIVFPSGGLPEMIDHGVDGFVCRDRSATALAEALECYLKDPALSRRHGEAARDSLARLGESEFADRWLAVYEAAE